MIGTVRSEQFTFTPQKERQKNAPCDCGERWIQLQRPPNLQGSLSIKHVWWTKGSVDTDPP